MGHPVNRPSVAFGYANPHSKACQVSAQLRDVVDNWPTVCGGVEMRARRHRLPSGIPQTLKKPHNGVLLKSRQRARTTPFGWRCTSKKGQETVYESANFG